MITHPLIYCDWLEEQGKDVTLLREDLGWLQREHFLNIPIPVSGRSYGDAAGGGYGYGNLGGWGDWTGYGCNDGDGRGTINSNERIAANYRRHSVASLLNDYTSSHLL